MKLSCYDERNDFIYYENWNKMRLFIVLLTFYHTFAI